MPVRQPQSNTGEQKQRRSSRAAPSSLLRPVHVSIPGRARLKVAALYRCERVKVQLESSLGAIPGIRVVQANILTGNILLLFAPEQDINDIVTLIESHLGVPNHGACQTSYANQHPDSVRDNISSVTEHRRTRFKRSSTRSRIDRDKPIFDAQLWHAVTTDKILDTLETSESFGLSSQQAADLFKRYGPNLLPTFERRSRLGMLLEQFLNLPVGLLGVSAVISVMTGGVLDATVIMGVVSINAAIGYFTEQQAETTIGALIGTNQRTARVMREGVAHEIPVEAVVVGDILLLAPGTYVPADARLLQTHHLSVDESALTGESMPATKTAELVALPETPLGERSNMVYMGTTVTGGSGLGVVVATATYTELGQIQTMVGTTRPPETPMQKQLGNMGTQLALLSGGVCAGVFGLGLLRGYGRLEMLKVAISLAVAAVPEGLPAVATTTLAMGIQNMRKHRVAVRHLDAVETLGAVQVFCMDKTGTLTLNRMSVVSVHTGMTRMVISDNRFFTSGTVIEPLQQDELLRLLQVIVLCSETEVSGDSTSPTLNGSATENALVEAAMAAGVDITALRQQYPREKVRYRSERRPFMTTIHRLADGRRLVAMKGSPEAVLSKCHRYLRDGDVVELDDDARNSIIRENEIMAGDALRVLGVAYAHIDSHDQPAHDELVWLGLVGMADPLRTGMADLMAVYHKAGIRTVMITGDQSSTAYAIGKQLNLNNGEPLEILDSSSLDKVDPALLAGLVRKVHIFARVSPAHKLQIVQALQQAGNVVAMTGDGINDGPALKAADIGVAMGKSGTDVARSVADVVLQDDNLDTMVVAVSQGRSIYSNIRKTIHYLLATNFTEIEVMLVGIALGLGQPLNPMQLLWINLISDIFPGLALSLEPAEPEVLDRPPRDPTEPIIRQRDLKRMALESAVITTGTMASYGYALLRYGPGPRASTQAFTTLSIGQLLHAISCRSDKTSLFNPGERSSNSYLNLALGGSLVLQLLAATVPGLRKLLGTTPIGIIDSLVIGAGASLPLLINEISKQIAAETTNTKRQPEQTDKKDKNKTILDGDLTP